MPGGLRPPDVALDEVDDLVGGLGGATGHRSLITTGAWSSVHDAPPSFLGERIMEGEL